MYNNIILKKPNSQTELKVYSNYVQVPITYRANSYSTCTFFEKKNTATTKKKYLDRL